MTPDEIRRESERQNGVLSLDGDYLRYKHHGKEVWALFVPSLVLIAEHTNDSGPFVCDYFYVFIAGEPLIEFEAPMYAGPAILGALSARMQTQFGPGLASSTEFKSRVIWPPSLAGQPFYEYGAVRRSGIFGWVMDRVFPRIGYNYTERVRECLESRHQERGDS